MRVGIFDHEVAVFAVDSADLNNDETVNAQDLFILQDQWMTDGDVSTPPEARPSAEVLAVEIPPDNQPEITFSLLDANGEPLSATGLTIRWILSRLIVDNQEQDRAHYESYTHQQVSNSVGPFPPGTVMAEQATYDSGGMLTDLGNGQFLYKFGTSIELFDPTLTHTVGGQIERRVGGQHVIKPLNPLYTFRPDGGPLTSLPQYPPTESCNVCHDRLEVHGGGRREVGLCVLCHNPAEGNIDPDSGNAIDMAAMIHKIHRGANLPTVAGGTEEYVIYGFGGAPHNYSNVHYPQDIRNCDSCHVGPHHLETPSRRACGSCHNDVNFDTGEGHSENSLPQTNDDGCVICHPATGIGFGQSVQESHTPPRQLADFPTWSAEILGVENAAPGSAPEITFSLLKEIQGATSVVEFPTEVNRLRINVAPLDVDYCDNLFVTASPSNVIAHQNGTYTMTLDVLPATAEGTYGFGLEARGNTLAQFGGLRPVVAPNPVGFAAVTGTLMPRREVVDNNKCMGCHDLLLVHGDNRSGAQYCLLCHRPNASDLEVTPPGVEPVSIDFKYMIHKIHTGVNLNNPYTVHGFGGTPHDFTEVHYSGDRRSCDQCHLPETKEVPIEEGAKNTTVENQNGTVVLDLIPEIAACNPCHDSSEALAHAMDTAVLAGLPGGGENCAACHGEEAVFSVEQVHKKGP